MMIVYSDFVFAVKMSDSTAIVLFMELAGETVIDNTISHMHENHAIKPEEMITCMRLKILENVQAHQSPPPTSHSSYNNRFSECRA